MSFQEFLNEQTIQIKKSHEGDLHKALGIDPDTELTDEDLEKASKSDDESIRKMAQFAINAKKWKH